jgi:hypothetical protein
MTQILRLSDLVGFSVWRALHAGARYKMTNLAGLYLICNSESLFEKVLERLIFRALCVQKSNFSNGF